MIELSEPLQTAVEQQTETVEVINPRTQVHYMLVRAEVFQQLEKLAYEDSPWTDAEPALLASEAGQSIGWNEMDEYDHSLHNAVAVEIAANANIKSARAFPSIELV